MASRQHLPDHPFLEREHKHANTLKERQDETQRHDRLEAVSQKPIWALSKAPGYFAAVVTGDQVATGKPDPSIFTIACRHLGEAFRSRGICGLRVRSPRHKGGGLQSVALAANGVIAILMEVGADEIITDFSFLRLDAVNRLFN